MKKVPRPIAHRKKIQQKHSKPNGRNATSRPELWDTQTQPALSRLKDGIRHTRRQRIGNIGQKTPLKTLYATKLLLKSIRNDSF